MGSIAAVAGEVIVAADSRRPHDTFAPARMDRLLAEPLDGNVRQRRAARQTVQCAPALFYGLTPAGGLAWVGHCLKALTPQRARRDGAPRLEAG